MRASRFGSRVVAAGIRAVARGLARSFARSSAFAVASAALATAALASPNVPPPRQAQPLVVTGATLHTVAGGVIANGSLRVEAGRIVAVGAADTPVDTRGATLLRLDGKHVYPGFISANSVLGLSEIASVRGSDDQAEVGPLNPSARALVAVNPDSELIPVTRAGGVLAALAVPQASEDGLVTGISALVQLDGWTWEDMSLEPAVALHVNLPRMRFNAALFPPPLNERLAELKRVSAERLQLLDDAFERAAAYRRARASGDAGVKVDTRWEAMLPVLEGRRPVFVQADDALQIRYALGLAERHRLRIVIVGGGDAAAFAEVLRERRIPVVIAGVHRLPSRPDDAFDAPYRLAAQLARAGVAFCIAREAGAFASLNDRNLPYEAATAAAFGLDPAEALKAITLYPAQILGVADRLGSLEIGKLASFIVTDGDPFDVRSRVERAFVQGREIDLSNRQTRLTDKYREKYRQQGGK